MGFRPCAVIPSRNHYREIEGIVSAVRAAGMPAFIIDDGSDEPARTVLAKLHDPAGLCLIVRTGFVDIFTNKIEHESNFPVFHIRESYIFLGYLSRIFSLSRISNTRK